MPEAEIESGVLPEKIGTRLIPGDSIGRVNAEIQIGPGLMQIKNQIIVTKAGFLHHNQPHKYWVESNQRRYIPALNEMIVGVVLERHMEGFKVDIGSAYPAALGWEGFETSSRKNRAQWPPGSVIYGRVTLANKDMEPEIACINSRGKSKGFGKLDGGVLIKCSLSMSKDLLSRDCAVLKYLGQKVPYEIAVGLNGRVWLKSNSVHNTILVSQTIQQSENIPDEEVEKMVTMMIERAADS